MKKMNKKGFTLVELLAVIAILAILILLVAPNILKMFNEGKESIFVQQAQRVMDSSNNKYIFYLWPLLLSLLFWRNHTF